MLSLAQIVVGILALALASPTAYECIIIGGDQRPVEFRPPPPLRVKGRLCGKVAILGAENADMSGEPLHLVGRDDRVVATTAIVDGAFAFPGLPPAVYRIEWVPGFGRTTEIEVESGEDGACSMPLTVGIRLPDECDGYSHVSIQRPTVAR